MKRLGLVLLALLAYATNLSWAQGADLYNSKCAVCHGPAGESTRFGPALKSTKMSEAEIVVLLARGASL